LPVWPTGLAEVDRGMGLLIRFEPTNVAPSEVSWWAPWLGIPRWHARGQKIEVRSHKSRGETEGGPEA
jgi:hypothetical protein